MDCQMNTEAITPRLRSVMAQTYRDLAEENYRLGIRDQADRCLRNASACEYGGVIDLEAPEGMP